LKRFVFCFCASLIFTFAPAARGQARPATHKPAATTHHPTTHRRTTHVTIDPALLHPATLHSKAPETYEVKFVTTKGDFVVEVHRLGANGS